MKGPRRYNPALLSDEQSGQLRSLVRPVKSSSAEAE